MTYNCSWDLNTLLWTIGIGLLLLIVTIILIKKIKNSLKDRSHWLSTFYFVIILLMGYIVIDALIKTPLNIHLSDNSIKINRLIKDININYSSIKEIRLVTEKDISNETRNFGSTGFFGDLGRYSSKTLGVYEKFCTNAENQILIETLDSKKYIISCDKPNLLVEAVNNALQEKL